MIMIITDFVNRTSIQLISINKTTHIGKLGVATTRWPKSVGPQNPTKNLAHWVELLGKMLYQKTVPKN